jgi:hypothetical protein
MCLRVVIIIIGLIWIVTGCQFNFPKVKQG